MLDGTILHRVYPERPDWSWKGNFGKLLVIGGSKTYSGSPGLAALAAFAAGVDQVKVFAPKRAADIAATFTPDLVTIPATGDSLGPAHVKAAVELAGLSSAVVIGGGLEQGKGTKEFVLRFLELCTKPCVIDSDAIPAVADVPRLLKRRVLVTPHTREFWVLTGEQPEPDAEQRAQLVAKHAKMLSTTILLKGHVDVVSNGELTEQSATGNPYMTKGGTGDVLAGIAGAFLAAGHDPFTAGCAAAWLSGAAGDFAAERAGHSLTATKVIEAIPEILAEVNQVRRRKEEAARAKDPRFVSINRIADTVR